MNIIFKRSYNTSHWKTGSGQNQICKPFLCHKNSVHFLGCCYFTFRLISTDEICWDTTNPENQTERLEMKATFDSVTSQGDYVIKAFWRNGQTSTLSALNIKNSCDFGTVSYLENDLQVFGIQSDVDSYYTVGRIGSRRTKYSLTLPDRSFAVEMTNNDWRLKQYEVKFLFGLQRDYPRLQVKKLYQTKDS